MFNFSSAWIIYFFSPSGHMHCVSKPARTVVAFFVSYSTEQEPESDLGQPGGQDQSSRAGRGDASKNRAGSLGSLYFGGFYWHLQGFFLKICRILEGASGSAMVWALSTCCAPQQQKIPSAPQSPTQSSHSLQQVKISPWRALQKPIPQFSIYQFSGQCLLCWLQ